MRLPGLLSEVVFACYIVDNVKPGDYQVDGSETLISSPDSQVWMHSTLTEFAQIINDPVMPRVQFLRMPPGFVCLLKTKAPPGIRQTVMNLNKMTEQPPEALGKDLFAGARPSELNHLLFRCEQEEKDISRGKRGPYGLAKYGEFKYAGLQSFVHLIRQLKVSGDMGDEFLDNIRQGDWMIDYIAKRIEAELVALPGLKEVSKYLQAAFTEIKKLPLAYQAYKPKYACKVVEKVFNAAVSSLLNEQMSTKLTRGCRDPFIQELASAVLQMYASVPSAVFKEFQSSMCAGLPHFSTGYTRCWGRDTFIALKGLFLVTGLYKEARDTIIYFAKVERHGLIPNLHDAGNNTRFNARDATWFFLQAIKDYIQLAPDGIDILKEEFEPVFGSGTLTIESLIIRILEAHARGIKFRELNAGKQIDEHMVDEGFDIRIETDWEQTGFCFGGNQHNCGTWMDKMGSAWMNKGVPATPRDGAPVELVALQYSVLSFLDELNKKGLFAHKGVKRASFGDWATLIKQSFNACFYIPESVDTGSTDYCLDSKLIKRRGVYKDTFATTPKETDYQLRPNLCIAMAVAPELFQPEQARRCLEIVQSELMSEGAMGIKTLDPADPAYRGDYDNDDETSGHNYHQGPEWLWPVGYFL